MIGIVELSFLEFKIVTKQKPRHIGPQVSATDCLVSIERSWMYEMEYSLARI